MFTFRQFAFAAAFAMALPAVASAQPRSLVIPEAMQNEHHHLFEALGEAANASGKTGEAAKRAMAVLKPHFEKEERFALPQLGALDDLTKRDANVSPELLKDLIARTEKFRTELPAMLQEHTKISAALREMKSTAEEEKNGQVADLAEMIREHAGMEEQVLYPAALLVGEHAKALLDSTK